jgi:phosphoesterase RecJ-like protein
MTEYPEADDIAKLIQASQKIVIVQADNPDGDSLASALALEEILGDLGKDIIMYCGVDIPSYLRYFPSSSRVVNELPNQFDMSIIVDTSSDSLLEQLNKTNAKKWLAAKPSVIIDHHSTEPTIDFARIILNHAAVATGEVIYELAQQLKWPLNQPARELIAAAILSDSLGLTSEAVTARSIHIIAELVEQGDGRITAKIRCNYGKGIGDKLAEQFGGGGHPYAAGFRISNAKFDDIKLQTIDLADKLLEEKDAQTS